MTGLRPIPPWVCAGGLAIAIVSLVALAWSVASHQPGRRSLPDQDGSRLEWLIDPGKGLSLEAIAARPAEDWRFWDGREYLRAAAHEALWLRVTLRNPGASPRRGVLQDAEYYQDRTEAWVAEEPDLTPGTGARGLSGWRPQISGESLSAGGRPWWTFTAAFLVEVPARSERIVYLRGMDYYGSFSRWQWWPRMEDYFSNQFRDVLVKGAWFGALVALLIYNVGLWLRLRFGDMACYLGYAVAMAAFNFAANGGLALVGGVVGPAWKNVIMLGAAETGILFLIAFARLFLETAVRTPRLDRGLGWLSGGWIAVLFGTLTIPWVGLEMWRAIIVAGLAVTHLLLLGAAVAAWRGGLRPARFFVAAFGALAAGGLPAAVIYWNDGDLPPMALGVLVGSTLEMLLFSLAMADRFATTQRRLAEETEQRHLLQESYADELALEVRERTRELEAANADKDRMLTVIGHDLRSPLTSLMKSAEQPAADFARETAHTGRALLLMIEDLVLWARMRAGTREIAAHPAPALLQPAVALHRTLADQGGTELVLDVPEALRVETDLVLAQTLVRNLLANALRFARSRVVLRAAPAESGVRFVVSNDGPCLPADVVARLAADLNEPMTATGGLGLRLCREICTGLGTRLEARIPPEGGAEFAFTLPAAAWPGEENT